MGANTMPNQAAAAPAVPAAPATQLQIFVSQQCGTYVTSTVRGKRASATMGPRFAAQRLAHKLYGQRVVSVAEVAEGNCIITKWLITFTPEVA
jgi:hypothetical protein